MSRADDPAFPAEEVHGDGVQQVKRHQGVTIREYFAAHAMTGIIAARSTPDLSYEAIAALAYEQADAMLAYPARGVR
jgi:hypothetical protein